MNRSYQINAIHCIPVDEAIDSCEPLSGVRLKIRAVCGSITPDNYATMLYDVPPASNTTPLKLRNIWPEPEVARKKEQVPLPISKEIAG